MTKLAASIGKWAAWAETVAGYAYLAGYIALLAVFPMKPWVDIQTFAAELGSTYFSALTILQVLAFMQSLLVLVIALAMLEYAPADKRSWGGLEWLLHWLSRSFQACITTFNGWEYGRASCGMI
jgi:hypothetical protein